MPLWVSIRGAPIIDRDECPVFNPAVWWKAEDLLGDGRFRVLDPIFHHSVASLTREEMRDLQERFRPLAEGVAHWKRDSDRLDSSLRDRETSGRFWVVSVYEWQSEFD